MTADILRLLSRYPAVYIYPTSRTEVLAYLERLAAVVRAGEDFERFPEGALGAVLHMALRQAVMTCTDPGDVALIRQAVETLTRASFAALCGEPSP